MRLTKTKLLHAIVIAATLILSLSALIGCEKHTEHIWLDYPSNSVAATCTESGTAAYYCAKCDETKTETVPATGHDMQLSEDIEVTCETDGVKNYKCSNCDKTETETIPHTGHDIQPSNRQEPTCELDGFQNYKCTKCEKAYAENLPAPGHNMQPTDRTEPTCEADGVQNYKCTKCEKTSSEILPATGHDMQPNDRTEPTCEADGVQNYKCTKCEKTESTVLPAILHDWKTKLVAPTYTTNGRHYRECLFCAKTELIYEETMLNKDFIESNLSIFAANSNTAVELLLTDAQKEKIKGYNGNTSGVSLGNAMALTGIDGNGKIITVLTPEYGDSPLALPAGATYYLKLSSFKSFSAEFTFTPDPQIMAAAGIKTTQDFYGETTYDISEYDTLTLTVFTPLKMTQTYVDQYKYMILVDCGQSSSGWSYFGKQKGMVLSYSTGGVFTTITIPLSDMKQYKNASLTTFKNISLRFTGWDNCPNGDGKPVDGYEFYVSSIYFGRKDYVEITQPSQGYEKCTHTLEDGSSAFERITVTPTCRSAGYDADKCALCQKVNVVDDYTAYKPLGTHTYVTAETEDGTAIVRYCTTCDFYEERLYGYTDPNDPIPTYGFFMLPQLDDNGNEYKNTTTQSLFAMNLILREAGITRCEDSDGFGYYDYHRYGSSHSYLEARPPENYFTGSFVFEVILRLGEPDANGHYPSGTFQMIERGTTDTFLTFATLNAEGKLTFPNCDIEIPLTQDAFSVISIALHTDINRYDIYYNTVMIAKDIPISETVDPASFNMTELRFMQFSKNSTYGIGASIHIGGIYIYNGGIPIYVEDSPYVELPTAKKED